jgi:hypothetical protein
MPDRKGALYDERLEQSLRTAGAAIHEGKTFDVTGLANLCIEVADHLARVRSPDARLTSGSDAWSVDIARCPEHGLHGQREECFVCGGPVEQVPVVEVDHLKRRLMISIRNCADTPEGTARSRALHEIVMWAERSS